MDHLKYFTYLNKISWRGMMYRRNIVYKWIKKYTLGKVLDVGCGIGLFLEYMPSSVGVDVNEECVKFCVERGLKAKLMDYDKLPFEKCSFDTIILDNVLEHIENPIPLLLECNRVLKENGKIIVLVPGKKGYLRDNDHKHYYDHASLRHLLLENGYTVKYQRSLPFRGIEHILSAFCFFAVGQKSV